MNSPFFTFAGHPTIPPALAAGASRPQLSVVSPCFNEEEVLPELYRRLTAVCQSLALSYEIVLVNDGSKDRTWQMMCALAEQDPALVMVNLSRNHGHQLALSAGLTVCRGDRVLIIDADLQDPPELLPQMLQLMDEGADVVYGQRQQRAGESWFKLWSASVFYRLLEKLTDIPIPRDTGDFRLMSRRALDVLISMPERHRFIRGMVSWIGFPQRALPYNRDARFAGVTKYPLRRMVRFALDAVTAFSVRPLAFTVALSMATACLSLMLMVYSLFAWWFKSTIVGWTSTASMISMLGSIQLFVLGIIGEYLGRLYEQSKNRPLFIIQDIVCRTPAAPAPDGGVGAGAPVEPVEPIQPHT